jgi:hypothetical protein
MPTTHRAEAGTTSVRRAFEQIFRRERIAAAFIEGDARRNASPSWGVAAFGAQKSQSRTNLSLNKDAPGPRGLFRLSDAFSRHQFSTDYTISMFGFDLRQGVGN